MQLSRAQRRELNQVNEGLALGCLSLGLLSTRPDRTELMRALELSWDRWPHAHKFLALTRGTVFLPALLADEMVRRNRHSRASESAFWRVSADGTVLCPVKVRPEPSTMALLHEHRSNGMHWESLAASFITHLDSSARVAPPALEVQDAL